MRDEAAIRRAYDSVAQAYVGRFVDELTYKPLDRALLKAFVEQLPLSNGLVADIGCGPGHVARYLRSLGSNVIGVDLSPVMVAMARDLDPAIEFQVGDMSSLSARDSEWDGIVAFYSIIHLEPADRRAAMTEFFRVLRHRGLLMISIHVGSEVRHVDKLLGQAVSLDYRFMETAELGSELQAAGFEVLMTLVRSPYEPQEAPPERGYVLARKP